MDVSSYVLLSQEQALRRKLDIVANNMANANTVGFKREQALFHEYVEQTTGAPLQEAKNTSFVLDYGAIHDTSQGAFQSTGNPLDVMIDGPGYLSVEMPDGSTAYTRAGFLKVLQSGDLATSGGQRILGEGGRPINIPPDQMVGLTIANDGTINGPQGPLGRLTVTTFADEASVSPEGDGFVTGKSGTLLAAANTSFKAGGVEASNVQPIVETTQMVDIMRSYETSVKMADSLAQMRQRAIERLGKAS
ncbi:MAG: flagellar basal-body rod protein FlgF [Alphaproteobacteria bacterium]|nr:flagellar basal-body rod protein FlgF [Alphaproteobacteria bacterium]MDB5722197.1 flagellar basal-body rod protein FlgF [Alphaproteobacteria bacterium]